LFVLIGAILLSAKGIYAKLLYQGGMDFITLMAVRNLLALPFFTVWGLSRSGISHIVKARPRVLCVTLLAGLVSFYLGGIGDFYALTLIDASLERVILFTYPAMIVLVLALRLRRWPQVHVLSGLLLTSLGIMLAIGGFDAGLWQANKVGALLVLACAVTYAGYFFANDYAGNQMGTRGFVFIVTTSSTLAVWLHFLVVHDLRDITISGHAWILLAAMTVTTTVAPVALIAEGVRRVGAQRGALLSTVGPPSTIVLSALFLGESLRWFQLLGMLAVLAGIYVLERRTVAPPPVTD
jgi:drug/metabolite transporter (DMT)-like permease